MQQPSPTESLPPGFAPESFGKYFLIDKVAIGGMAEVFKAKTFSHGGFEKLLVIKRILQHLSDNREFVDMFIDEAKISVLLQQPNIVQTYDFGKIRENYFIAMECVEGKDLKGILRKLAERRKLLPIEYAVYICHEVCKGLDYAHKKANLRGEPLGIVHRDMSPSNVLVAYTGEIKIADFGIAKAEISIYNTKDGVLKGKFEYMSPEQASGQPIDARSDIFAVGIMLHEMLTGRRLFKSESEIRTLERIKAVDVKPPSDTNPNVPARLDEIVMRALSRDVADRYADAREFQTDLLEFMYPTTPDLTRESLGYFMAELFVAEIDQERNRMEAGTQAAVALFEEEPELELEPAWQESPGTSTQTMQQSPPSKVPLIVATVAVLLAAGVAAWVFSRPDTVVERIVEVQAPSPTHGALDINITPAVEAMVSLGGQVIGRGPKLAFPQVEPDKDLELKVEAEGYEPFVSSVRLAAGERLLMPVTLVAMKKPTTPTTPGAGNNSSSNSGLAGTLMITSSPSGASVWLDGENLGRTPLRWDDGTKGQRYVFELRLDGYDPAKVTATYPEGGEKPVSRNLTASAAGDVPGKISVNVSQGWAEVWIDGTKIDTTPLYNHEITAGTHTVRVVNPGTGYESTRKVTISGGKTERLSFDVE